VIEVMMQGKLGEGGAKVGRVSGEGARRQAIGGGLWVSDKGLQVRGERRAAKLWRKLKSGKQESVMQAAIGFRK